MRSSLGLDGEGSITPPAAVCDSFTAVQTEDAAKHPRSEVGQSRPNWAVRAMSGLPPIATGLRTSRIGCFVPKIGIGGSHAAPPLPHHRTYGSVYGGSRSYANALRSRTGVIVQHPDAVRL